MKPPESFVPLTAASAASGPREFRVSILNGHNHAPGDSKASHLDATGGPAPGTPSASPPESTAFRSLAAPAAPAVTGVGGMEKKLGEPRVTVQREGDRVTHLRIQCTCGQIMELACVYDAPPSGGPRTG
jgi:hypothetical protein